jgi:hypothetical protein
VLTYLLPGLRFFHQGQLEGFIKRIPIQLRRGPWEHPDPLINEFYKCLLSCLKEDIFRKGNWQLTDCLLAWEGNWTTGNFIAYTWTGKPQQYRLVVVNYTSYQSQCYVRLLFPDLGSYTWQITDLLGKHAYTCDGRELVQKGLYLDMVPWGYHVFKFEKLTLSIPAGQAG